MTMSSVFTEPSFLLSIPTELRLQIYDYLIADSNAVTIAAAPLTLFGRRINDPAFIREVPGLPSDHCPLIHCCYDPALLSISDPPMIELDNGMKIDTAYDKLPLPAPSAMLQTCRLIHEEIGDYMRRKTRGNRNKDGLSIYVTYPYGVLVLKNLYPFLLHQAKNIYISGYYTPRAPEPVSPPTSPITPTRNHNNNLRQRPRLRLDPPREIKSVDVLGPYSESTANIAPDTLSNLTRTIFPPTPTHLNRLEVRIYYTGPESYKSMWGDDNGPIVRVLSNICGGKIDMEVNRGRRGNAVKLTVAPSPKTRIVNTTWQRLGDSIDESEGFVIGEDWGNAI